jgi:hypothetical protein
MLKKIILGILTITVVGAGAAAATYAYAQKQAVPAQVDGQLVAEDQLVNTQSQVVQAQEPQAFAEGMEGEPFSFSAEIVDLDANGINVVLDSGESVFVELGPEDYWTALEPRLAVGDRVAIVGSVNEGMYHAETTTTADNQTLVLRAETGQPMWSGGVSNGKGQNGAGAQDGSHSLDPQAVVEEWVTINGTIVSMLNGAMTIQLEDGTQVSFQTGQPRFLTDQGVTFSLGEAVEVIGFYSDGQFVAGDITQLSTGLKVMLRDPNGRPLWAGPGNGNGNGNLGNTN